MNRKEIQYSAPLDWLSIKNPDFESLTIDNWREKLSRSVSGGIYVVTLKSGVIVDFTRRSIAEEFVMSSLVNGEIVADLLFLACSIEQRIKYGISR